MPLFSKELLKSIQKRCRIQPGMLIRARTASGPESPEHSRWSVPALVIGLSPSCEFDRYYKGAEEHIFYRCQPVGDAPSFVDYVCNMEQVL